MLAGAGTLTFFVAALGSAAHAHGFWGEAVAEDETQRFDQLARLTEEWLSPERGMAGPGGPLRPDAGVAGQRQRAAKAEPIVRQALALRSDDLRLTLALAEIETTLGHGDDAVRTLRRALSVAVLPGQQALWQHLAAAYTSRGQYAQAVAATDRQLALGATDGAIYANVAELLMALGRLPEAEDRYREAIRADEDAPDRRLREHSLALSYYGLGVALDRDAQAAAGREMIGRALALDPGMALLQLAQQPGGDVSFLPAGDVHYYLALALEVAARVAEAEDAFRAFLAAQPNSHWEKPARAHLAALQAYRQRRSGRTAFHVVATATVHASGPIPAPLIDAAWRRHPDLIDACAARLPPLPGREPLRITLEIEIDARGALTRAAVPRPQDLDRAFVACVESAVKDGLVVSALTATTPATRPRSTLARLELLLAD